MGNTEARFWFLNELMNPLELASVFVCNSLQNSGVNWHRYGFSIRADGRTRAYGWCLSQLAARRNLGRNLWPCLPLLRVAPELMCLAAAELNLTSGNIFAFLCLIDAALRDNPTRATARKAYAAVSRLFRRFDLSCAFGYVLHDRHNWPDVIYNILQE